MTLPQLTEAGPFLTDGGLETCLIFESGIDLAEFAAFPLLDSESGRTALTAYYRPFLSLAAEHGVGFVLDTPTWRANPDWGARLGYDTAALDALNGRAVEFARDLAVTERAARVVVNGVIGPRGDGYAVGAAMSPAEAEDYHGAQVRAFADAGTDMITVVTMTYAAEAIGATRAATAAGLPIVVSFTVETDGALPSGQPLGEAITEVDAATGAGPAYFMVNCAHPTHLAPALEDGAPWLTRVRGLRSNASRLSHAELDEAETLDRGDPAEWAALHAPLRSVFDLRVVGGCCGTDDEHVAALAHALVVGAEQDRAERRDDDQTAASDPSS